MLQIIKALLLILAALGQDHTATKGQIFQLDMANNSVDDIYYGCRKKTARLVETKYLKKELDNDNDFKKIWEKGKKKVNRSSTFSSIEQKIAIFVYTYTTTNPNLKIYGKFNNDTHNGKQEYTMMKYKWNSLHFLLTQAMHILKKKQNRCFYTFRGTKFKFEKHLLNKVIRFGSFSSSSFDQGIARNFGNESCFEIHTCEGADITKYSMFPHEKEVLIPPYEMFNVTAVKTKGDGDGKNLWCNTVFVLNSTGIRSDLNCALFKKQKP